MMKRNFEIGSNNLPFNEFYPFVFYDNKPFLIKRAYSFFVCFLAHPEQAVNNFRRAFVGYGNKAARCFQLTDNIFRYLINPGF